MATSKSTVEHPDPDLAIECPSLNFTYGGPPILRNLSFNLPKGARCLLLGANGAGKSTLLRILAGKRLVHDAVLIKQQHAYFHTPEGITYLGPEWIQNPITKRDLRVATLLDTHRAGDHPARTRALLTLLEVDPLWHTHQISDGQRRRVQLLLGFLQPFDVLLLDEVTVDLDVLVRRDVLDFLQRECEVRGCTVVYCTHIFDGMGDWPTHVARMRHGEMMSVTPFAELIQQEFPAASTSKEDGSVALRFDSPLLQIVHRWLKEDREYRRLHRLGDGELRSATKWDALKDDMRAHGDKYYDYWFKEDSY
ncbi:CCR4-NOT regulatory complex component [Sorochytrium milnesiophthora]